jgi:ABC-type nitrate/sulfonate/bicarbonate transport system substrate-binding protein
VPLISSNSCSTAVNVLHVGSTTPSAAILLSMARQRGIFAKHGLDVPLVFVPGTEVPQLSAANPFGLIGAPAAIMRAAAGSRLKILACFNTARMCGRLVAAPSITRPEHLRRARFGVRAWGAGQWIQTVAALEFLGLELGRDEIRTLPVGDEAQIVHALEAGDIEAAIVSSAQAHLLKARGFSDLLDLYPAQLHGFPNALAVTVTQLRRCPDTAERLVAALIESMAFCLAPRNEPVIVDSIARLADIGDAAAARASYHDFLLTSVRKPYPCLDRLLQMQKTMALQDPKVREVNVPNLIDDRIVRQLDESGAIDRLSATAQAGGLG